MSTVPASDRGNPEILHRERMLPSTGVWIVLVVLGAMFGVVLVPLSITLAAVVAPLGVLSLCAIGWTSSPLVTVTRHELTAGRARIATGLLGDPEELPRPEWTRVMGTGFQPLAYHCTRGWIHTGVRVPLHDDDDPTPAWVVSSRRPEDLALALRVAGRGDRSGQAAEHSLQ